MMLETHTHDWHKSQSEYGWAGHSNRNGSPQGEHLINALVNI